MVAYQDHQEAEMVVLLKVEAAAVEVWDLICQTESILSSVYLFFLILPFFLFFPFYGSECYDFLPPSPLLCNLSYNTSILKIWDICIILFEVLGIWL